MLTRLINKSYIIKKSEKFHWDAKTSECVTNNQGVTLRKKKPLHIVQKKRTYRGITSYLTEK